ncbi:hydrogenase maturation protease [Planctomycetota bacterium]
MNSNPYKEKAKNPRRNILIIGVGNRLLGDEGVGLHITDRLSQIPIPSHVDVVDCGCDLLSLTSHAYKPRKIIIIDAIRLGGKPGRIYRFDYAELGATQSQLHSAHQLTTLNALKLLKQVCPDLCNCPITLIGVEPQTMGLSINLSREVSDSLVDVTRLVLEEVHQQILSRVVTMPLLSGCC